MRISIYVNFALRKLSLVGSHSPPNFFLLDSGNGILQKQQNVMHMSWSWLNLEKCKNDI